MMLSSPLHTNKKKQMMIPSSKLWLSLLLISSIVSYDSFTSCHMMVLASSSVVVKHHNPIVSQHRKLKTTTTTTSLNEGLAVHSNSNKDDNTDNGNDDIEFIDSRIEIHVPYELRTTTNPNGGLDHVKADYGFGNNVLGSGSIHTFVYYIDNSLCDPIAIRPHPGINFTDAITNETITYNYDSINVYPKPKSIIGGAYFKTPFILMANSEHCSTVIKVRNAQAVGAAAVVIVNEYCLCSNNDCIEKYGRDKCIDDEVFHLVNDGSAGDITIPSFLLINKIDAMNIINVMINQNQTILMELTWGLQPVKNDLISSDPIRFHLWTTAHDPLLDHIALRSFQLVNKAFTNEEVLFSPHYSILDGNRFGCTTESSYNNNDNNRNNYTNNPACNELCTNHGRYCTVHTKSLNGYQILKETIRQMCIWRFYSSTSLEDDTKTHYINSDIYWEYIIYHREHCRGLNEYDNEKCIIASYEHAKIPLDYYKHSKVIEDCMNTDGDLQVDTVNPLLQYHVETTEEYGIIQLPSITINKHLLDKPTASELFNTICEYFELNIMTKLESYPKICDTCGTCPNVIGCLQYGKCIPYETHFYDDRMNAHHNKTRSFLWTMFVLLILGFVSYYYYMKYYRNGGGGTSSIISGIDRTFLLSSYLRGGD